MRPHFVQTCSRSESVDWGHLVTLECEGQEQKLWAFTFTMGYSRRMMAEVALDQKIGSLRMHGEAFRQTSGVPEEILYDRMKTVWLGSDERGEIVWHPVLLDFARYWVFTPELCRPYRAQTKGKVESGVKYLRRNFLCGLQGREPHSLTDMNAQLREWISTVANQRVHGTTREQVAVRWDVEQFSLQSIAGRGRRSADIAGERENARVFCMRSMASGGAFQCAFPHASRQAFLEAHERAIAYFGGVFEKLRYDNLRSAVKRILGGHQRDEIVRFRYFRRNHLVPIPNVGRWEEFDALLLRFPKEDEQRIIGERAQSVREGMLIGREHLQALKEGFDLAAVHHLKVSASGCVKVLTNFYSTPLPVGAEAKVKVQAAYVEI